MMKNKYLCTKEKENLQHYDNVISLGFYCGTALEIERFGLHNYSFPFDWIITADFSKVINLIGNGFQGFLEYENLYQEASVCHKYFYDKVQDIHFYHDFKDNIPLKSQLPFVREKYLRRIKRFYDTIKKPTLFIRFCHSKEEIEYICENYNEIDEMLKSFNKNNEILYVTCGSINSLAEKEKFCSVKSKNKFMDQCFESKAILLELVDSKNRKKNLKLYRKAKVRRVVDKAKRIIRKKIINPKNLYNHDKQI